MAVPLTTALGLPGHSAPIKMALLYFVTVVSVVDLEVVSVAPWTRSRMSSVTHSAAATILHGLSGQYVRPVAEVGISNGKLVTVMGNPCNLIDKSVQMSSLFLTGQSGAPAVPRVEMV